MVENHGLVGIKTSFEDEGALFNEVIRLKEVCNQAKTKITLKIGGPEAIRDIKDSLVIGVKGLVAPMVESAFGLKKFVSAVKTHVGEDVLSSLQLNINVETKSAAEKIEEILNQPEADLLYGITVGRVDLVSSMDRDRGFVNNDEIYAIVEKIFRLTKAKGLKACLGGAISLDSMDFLQRLHRSVLLDKFETRYAIYDPTIALKNYPAALEKGQLFEYEWLMCKQEFYENMADQDRTRINMIRARIGNSSSSSQAM